MTHHGGTAGPTPMWPPAAPLRKNTHVGSPGPWNETPRVDGNIYPGKPMPPELAPGLDLYGTNEGGLTELFDEDVEADDMDGGAREDPGGSEQSVDDNDVPAVTGVAKDDSDRGEDGARETLPSTPASVQTMLQRMRARIREQDAYIQDLEDQILELNDRIHRNLPG